MEANVLIAEGEKAHKVFANFDFIDKPGFTIISEKVSFRVESICVGVKNGWISRLFKVPDLDKVLSFLETVPESKDVLLKAYELVRNHFPKKDLKLSVYTEPGEDSVNPALVIAILTDMEVTQALGKMDSFDDDWFNQNNDFGKNQSMVMVDVEFI